MEAIKRFTIELVAALGMKAFGAPVLQHLAEHLPEGAGYSLVQLIETSAITGHFCDKSGDAYIDIFSCLDFDVSKAVAIVEQSFKPRHVSTIILVRQALQLSKTELRQSRHGQFRVVCLHAGVEPGFASTTIRSFASLQCVPSPASHKQWRNDR
jgi:S-adenosylmethionine/arginine decarboxylase-like enzyme